MVSTAYAPDCVQIEAVFRSHTGADLVGGIPKFVDRLLQTLVIVDLRIGFQVLNSNIHGVPVGSIFLVAAPSLRRQRVKLRLAFSGQSAALTGVIQRCYGVHCIRARLRTN